MSTCQKVNLSSTLNTLPTCANSVSAFQHPSMAHPSDSKLDCSSVVVVIPLPAQGHAPVLIHFSRKLAAQGFPIVLINVESVHKKISSTWRSSPQLDIRLESIPFSYTIPDRIDDRAFSAVEELRDALLRLQDPLEELLVCKLIRKQGLKISCIVSDYHATWTTPVAQKLEIPQVCFWSGSAAWALIDHHISLLDELGYIPVTEAQTVERDATTQGDKEKKEKIVSFIPGMDPFPDSDLPYFLHDFSNVKTERLLAKSRRLEADKWFLANTFEALEPRETQVMKKILGPRFLSIGPLLPLANEAEELQQTVSLEQEELQCLDWLDSRPEKSVLYISFGSLAVISPEQFMQLVMGIESSGVSFLWVIRPAFLSPSTTDFFQKFRDRVAMDPKSLIVSWTSQQKVLAHTSVGAFLTHCGWNSVLESIWNGVPMLGWPCHSDQNLNCRLALEGSGAGQRISATCRTGVVSSDRVKEVVKELLDDGKQVKEAVSKLRGCAVASVLEGGSSWRDMVTFVRWLRSFNLGALGET